MRVSFIGAGKVGRTMGRYLQGLHEVIYYYSRSKKSALEAADYTRARATDDLKTLIEASEIIIITTPDNAIEKVVEQLERLTMDLTEKSFVHMSGALTTDVFNGLGSKVRGVASIHPLQTFSDIDKAVEDLKHAYFAFEGEDEMLFSWMKSFTQRYFWLKKSQKTQYHLSACIFSNYLVTLMDFGNRMLSDLGIDQGLEAMAPLILATLENILTNGPEKALTGPIQRGDTSTLEKHMAVLDGENLRAYQHLGQMTTNHLIGDSDQREILNALWRRYDKEIHR